MSRKFDSFAFSTDEQALLRQALRTAVGDETMEAKAEELARLEARLTFGAQPLGDANAQALILEQLVRDLLASGYAIDVNDNDGDRETHLEKGTDLAEIMRAIFSDEIDAVDYTLDCCKRGAENLWDHVGWVRVIDGNGTSVISDYSMVLEPAIAGAEALADMIVDDL